MSGSLKETVSAVAADSLTGSAVAVERCWLLVEYDGSAFHGSQYQSHQGVVLHTIESAISQAFHQLGVSQEVRAHCASRTDAGVHALGQVVQVTLPANALQKVPRLQRALNALLPPQLVVSASHYPVPLAASCQHHAKQRWYRYRISQLGYPSPWGQQDVWRFERPLCLPAMQEAATCLLGRHEFTTFKSANSPILEDTCELKSVCLWQDDLRQEIVIELAGDRFLYKMVRNLAAAMVQIGLGRYPPAQMAQWLQQRQRQAAPWTAPAHGLTLMAIAYPQEQDFFSEHVYVKLLHTALSLETSQHENVFRQAR